MTIKKKNRTVNSTKYANQMAQKFDQTPNSEREKIAKKNIKLLIKSSPTRSDSSGSKRKKIASIDDVDGDNNRELLRLQL